MTNTKDKSESNYQALLKELQASKDHFKYIRKKDGKALDDALAQIAALQAVLDAANSEIERLKPALIWYGEEAAAVNKNLTDRKDDGIMASLTVLSADAGKRAADAIQPAN